MHFNAAHRIFNPGLSDAENFQLFGACSHPNYHGHNYDLVLKVTGSIDARTGYVYDLKKLKELAEEIIISRFDHKNLNLDVVEFATRIPSAENIAVVIWHLLRPHIEATHSLQVVLYETERNFVEYSGE